MPDADSSPFEQALLDAVTAVRTGVGWDDVRDRLEEMDPDGFLTAYALVHTMLRMLGIPRGATDLQVMDQRIIFNGKRLPELEVDFAAFVAACGNHDIDGARMVYFTDMRQAARIIVTLLRTIGQLEENNGPDD